MIGWCAVHVVGFPVSCDMLCMQAAVADIEPHLSRVGDKSLRHVLSSGVAFLHATMTAAEKEVVTLLFNTGAIQVQ